MIPQALFLVTGRVPTFVHFSVKFCLDTVFFNVRLMSSNVLVFQTSSNILTRPAAFRLIFLTAAWSSSSVKFPSGISSWLLIVFFDRFVNDFIRVCEKIFEMFFSHLNYFFLAGSF